MPISQLYGSKGELFTKMSPFAAAPKWTIRGRHPGESLSRPSTAPGPGAYGEAKDGGSSKHQRAPSASFGKGLRDGMGKSNQAPGPGQYQLPRSASTPKFGFGTSNRPGSAQGSSAPGPGAYTLQSSLGHHGISIAARQAEGATRAQAPGPGAYTPVHKADERTEPKFSFGTGQRPGLNSSGVGKASPGPGAYQVPAGDPSLPRTPAFTLRPRREDPSVKSAGARGGGMYGPFTDMGRGPRYSMRGRSAEGCRQQKAPGPGAYTPNRLNRAPSASFGASTREDSATRAARRAPGPGQYDVKDPLSSPKFGFGSSSRPGSAEGARGNPGPGAYTLKSTLGDHGISMAPRQDDPTKRCPAPGPGAYTPKHVEEKSEPKFSMGTGQRPGLSTPNRNPGPGSYQLPSGLAQGGISMAPRREDGAQAGRGGSSMHGPFTQFG